MRGVRVIFVQCAEGDVHPMMEDWSHSYDCLKWEGHSRGKKSVD